MPIWLRVLGLRAWLFLGIVGVLVVTLAFLGLITGLLIPLVLAVVLAAIVVPIVERLVTWRFPRLLASLLVLVLGIALAVGTVLLILWGIIGQADQIGEHASTSLQKAGSALSDLDVDKSQVRSWVSSTLDFLVSGVFGGLLGSAATLMIGLVLGAFMLLYLLKDWDNILRWASGHVGISSLSGERVLEHAVRSFRGYARGMTVVALANGITMGVGAWILGVPLAMTIGVVTFVTAYVPIFGALFAGAFAVVIALGSEGLTDALIMLVLAILANNSLTNLIQPIAFGKTLQLHPLVVLLVTTGGTLLFGVFGAVLAAPVTAIILNLSSDLKADKQVAEPAEAPG